jgi:hypothetical protein
LLNKDTTFRSKHLPTMRSARAPHREVSCFEWTFSHQAVS